MKSLPVSVVVSLTLVSVTQAIFVLRFGECPKVPIKADFDVTKYTGKWWEYQRFPAPFELGSVCGSANYTLLSPNTVKVVNSGIQEIKIFGWVASRRPIEAIGQAVISNASEPAKLTVEFGDAPTGDGTPNYFVVDTDYDNYAIVFSCSPYGFVNIQFAWILTRARGVAPSNLASIYSTLRQSDVDISPFITVRQSNC